MGTRHDSITKEECSILDKNKIYIKRIQTNIVQQKYSAERNGMHKSSYSLLLTPYGTSILLVYTQLLQLVGLWLAGKCTVKGFLRPAKHVENA